MSAHAAGGQRSRAERDRRRAVHDAGRHVCGELVEDCRARETLRGVPRAGVVMAVDRLGGVYYE